MHCDSSKNILLLVEHRDGEINSVTYQLANKGQELANKMNYKLNVLLAGYKLNGLTQQLLNKGFETIFVADNPLLERYNPEIFSRVIADILKKEMPALFLLGHTYLGMELGPAIATRLDVRLVTDCINVELQDENLVLTRPMFGGLVHTKVESKKLPMILSIQRDVIPEKIPGQNAGTVIPVAVKIEQGDFKTLVKELLHQSVSGVDITKAEILVAAGQGIGKQTDLEPLKELAEAMHGTLACSRPLAQWGWLPADCYVGISGKTVHPKIYVACGISGAPQHIAGMKDSKMIIAINIDPKAPIFQFAHYGIVGDVHEIVPAMTKAIKEG